MPGFFRVTATFLASAVEMVEALTIILASGLTRGGWRAGRAGATRGWPDRARSRVRPAAAVDR